MAEEAEHRGLKVVHVHAVLRDVVAEVVRLAVDDAGAIDQSLQAAEARQQTLAPFGTDAGNVLQC